MKFLFLLFAIAATAPAFADESRITLKDGPNRDLVSANCVMCHSLDYIPMNSVFQDRKGWDATVNKMVKVMGAPIQQDDIPKIVEYLTSYYGK